MGAFLGFRKLRARWRKSLGVIEWPPLMATLHESTDEAFATRELIRILCYRVGEEDGGDWGVCQEIDWRCRRAIA